MELHEYAEKLVKENRSLKKQREYMIAIGVIAIFVAGLIGGFHGKGLARDSATRYMSRVKSLMSDECLSQWKEADEDIYLEDAELDRAADSMNRP